MPRNYLKKAVATCVLALTLAIPSVAAPITYHITVDTTVFGPSGDPTASAVGTTGSIDLQFNPTSGTSAAVTATISNFSSDGTLGGVLLTTGGASGLLPSTASIANTLVPPPTPNELQQTFTYGTTLSFDVTFSDNPTSGDPSSFDLTLLDNSNNPLFVGNPNSGQFILADITLNGDGSVTTTAFGDPNNDDGHSDATITPVETPPTPTPGVPEPATMGLLGLGLAGLAGWRRLRRSR